MEDGKEMRKAKVIIISLMVFTMLTGCCISHKWIEATCTTPKTCSKCDEIEGEALGHTEGEVVLVKEPTETEIGEKQKVCTKCNEILETEKVYFYDYTEEDKVICTNVLNTINSLKAIHGNPNSFEVLGISVNENTNRTTICLSYEGTNGQQFVDYFWKDIDAYVIKNTFGKNNYEGMGSAVPVKSYDVNKALYFEKCDMYIETLVDSEYIVLN